MISAQVLPLPPPCWPLIVMNDVPLKQALRWLRLSRVSGFFATQGHHLADIRSSG